jgi:hypothetical protein
MATIGIDVVVIVLGDLGRSPRMQYHAHSFMERMSKQKDGVHVRSLTLIGYEGERLMKFPVSIVLSADSNKMDLLTKDSKDNTDCKWKMAPQHQAEWSR